MPKRTIAQRKKIDSLPKKKSDKFCNARTGKGYCKNVAGFKTDHVGEGRCFLHGGRGGRTIVTGLYSKKLTSTVRKEFDKLTKDPALVDLYSEFALIKAFMSKIMEGVESAMDENPKSWFVQTTKGGKTVSAELTALMKVLENMRKIFRDITNYESKNQSNLGPKQMYMIINQVQVVMGDTCGSCPVRQSVGNKLDNIKTAPITSIETIKKE